MMHGPVSMSLNCSRTPTTNTMNKKPEPIIQILVNAVDPKYDISRVDAVRKLLRQIHDREIHRSLYAMSPGLAECLEEVIDRLDQFLDWEPSDADLTGEPPLSADERWRQSHAEHLEAHR